MNGRCCCGDEKVAGLFHDTFEHLAPAGRRLAVAASLARMPDMPAWRREATARRILDTAGRPCAPGAVCCRRAMDQWLEVAGHAAAA